MLKRISLLAVLLGSALVLTLVWLQRESSTDENATTTRLPEVHIEGLRALGYLDWSEAEASPEESGVMVWNRDLAFPGYTLIASRLRREAYLIGMDGQVVHTWTHDSTPTGTRPWEGVFMRPNGDLLVLVKFRKVLNLSWDSRLIWSLDIEAHHDISETPSGSFVTWVKEIKPFKGLLIRFPYLAEISMEGALIDSWSTYEHLDEIKAAFDQRSFRENRLASAYLQALLRPIVWWWNGTTPGRSPRLFDYFHVNTVNIIDENQNDDRREFRSGNLLICMRDINQIATLDPDTKEILWTWGEGELDWPHHPTMLESGNILIFDNGYHRGHTRVIEIDPVQGSIVWQYPEDPQHPEHRFYCAMKGSAQRLPNGNTLIGDGENGRSFEVTRDGEIVWEYFYPVVKNNKRATIYRSIRYPQAWVHRLLGSDAPVGVQP